MNIKNLLENGIKTLKEKNVENADLKAKMLLMFLLNVRKEYLIIHNDEELDEKLIESFEEKIEQLINGKPIQYITNTVEFMGLLFYVDESVLIPQPDTEILVEEAVNIIKEKHLESVLDLCTGSGAIAVSIKDKFQNLKVTASDISKKAIEIAKQNSNKNNVKIKLINSDMFENITEKFDIIVSNPPYIENDVIKTLSKEVQSEPYIALAGGEDGLEFYRIIAKESKKYLNQNGVIIVEIGYNQKDNVIDLFKNENFAEVYSKKDYAGNDRIVVAKA